MTTEPPHSKPLHARLARLLLLLVPLSLTACRTTTPAPMTESEQTRFATRYAAAWSNQDPEAFAAFYTEDGWIRVNDGEPAVGRDAIAAKARGFMEAFPDMVVTLQRLEPVGERVRFHWRWTGTNTGPGGNGRAVDLTGFEEWTLVGDRIAESRGSYDEAEYARQMGE